MCFRTKLRATVHRMAARRKAAVRLNVNSFLRHCRRQVPGGVVRSRKGMAAVEFGLIGAAFVTLIFAILEVALQLTTIAALEWATLRASRFGTTGANAVPGVTAPTGIPACRSAMIPWLVSYSTANYLKPANLTVNMAVLSGFGAAGAGTAGAGAGGAMVRYTLSYRQDFITPIIALLAGRLYLTHDTSLVIKNEPFQDSYCY